MKKIVFVDISMKEKLEAVSYENTGNACCAYKVPVVYPINAVLSEKIKKNANRIGLYDMSGNCWEFCSDRSNTVSTGEVTDPVASGTGCVRRGGGFYEEESTNIFNRSYQGETTLTTFLYEDNGFRIARTVK